MGDPQVRIAILIEPDIVEPGLEASPETMMRLLEQTELWRSISSLAAINAAVGLASLVDDIKTQNDLLKYLFAAGEIERINSFMRSCEPPRTTSNTSLFFRGQALETLGWSLLASKNKKGPASFDTYIGPVHSGGRSAFGRALLVGASLWNESVYKGSLVPAETSGKLPESVLVKFYAALRGTLSPAQFGDVLARSSVIFLDCLDEAISGFSAAFEEVVEIPLETYLACFAGVWSTLNKRNRWGDLSLPATAFQTSEYLKNVAESRVMERFFDLNTLTVCDLRKKLQERVERAEKRKETPGLHRTIWQELVRRPILRLDDSSCLIPDLVAFAEAAITGPIFRLLGAKRFSDNELFGGYGRAFERYCSNRLEDRFVGGGSLLHQTIYLQEPLRKGAVDVGDLDIALDLAPSLTVFEVKASFVRETKTDTSKPGSFIEEINERFGWGDIEKGGRQKGAAQLARIVTSLLDPRIETPNVSLKKVERLYTVMVVRDTLLAGTLLCEYLESIFWEAFLEEREKLVRDLRENGGLRRRDIEVVPLIVISIEDLEMISRSSSPQGLTADFEEYLSLKKSQSGLALNDYLASDAYKGVVQQSDYLATHGARPLTQAMTLFFPGAEGEEV